MTTRSHIFLITILFLILLSIGSYLYASVNTTIKGTVKDATTGEALWGANIIILGTGLGSSTDLNGNYIIQNLSSGPITLRVTYIGYKQQKTEVDIIEGRTIQIDFEMEPEVLEGETVIISTQREGQIAAINQQITSDAIKNIVAADKIEELPEANAAEAVGRLPGVSLQREGGEGNKVVIRGLAPKYNKVQIDGVDMAATDSDDRSTDLSMISPYMLDGIEVTKSAMADQEADQLGGTVNFILKGAPLGKQSYTILAEGGYNGLRGESKDYKLGGLTSLRILDDLIGVSVNLDIEKRNRSSNTVSAGYKYLTEDKLTVVNSLNVEDITREIERYNGSLVLDYKTPGTEILLSNMYSRIDRLTVSRSENSSDLHGSTSRSQYLNNSESNTTILMNQLRAQQYIGDFKVTGGVSYSYSKTDVPEELGYGGLESSPLASVVSYDATPAQVPSFMLNDVSTILLSDFYDSDILTKEDEFASFVDLEWEYRLSDGLNLKIQTGGKYKHKSREYDYNTIYLDLATDPSTIVNQAILEKWPWMASYIKISSFPYEPFIDEDYDPGDFMKGEYSLERVPDLELGKEMLHYLIDYVGVDWDGATTPQKFVPNFHESKMYDYNGKEDYWAAYIMPTFSIGNKITFIPGLRYEHNKTIYTGTRGDGGVKLPSVGYEYHEKTVTRENEFFLPMIHARYKPSNWFDVRASYTQTLTRPSYSEFLPSWSISSQPLTISYSNPNLKPAKAENYDLYFSLYGNKVGLFTVGLFTKNIDDLVFSQSKIILSDTMAVEEFGLTEEETGLSPSGFKGKQISNYVNNPNKTDVYGVEIEWQSNLWYLPGLLKNVVFSINYTYTHSETKYPRTVPIKKIVSSPFGSTETIIGNADSSYSAPLLYQPDHILNITLGYDYMGFSIRGSVQFKSRIFSQNDWRPQLRGYTDDFTIFDVAVSQKLPFEGLVLYGNLKNISKAMETDINEGTGFITNKEYYSISGSLGIRYKL
ncbi:MAG: TonB-dependent receptor [Ignavibacteria bacterium]|jgi:TonB-dependent receptor